jgi:TRAP-type C4-dicarboxylate transport system permease small subunit
MRRDAEEMAASEHPLALHKNVIPEGPVETVCKWACEAALIIMLVVIGTDIFTRWLLNFSFEISDEIGGYMLAAITFLSLSVCQVYDSFHHVELIQARLSVRGRAISSLLFDLLTLSFAALLLWHYVRLEFSSWRFGERAPTYLETPLWLPRLVMAIGAAALCLAVCRTIMMHIRRIRTANADALAIARSHGR